MTISSAEVRPAYFSWRLVLMTSAGGTSGCVVASRLSEDHSVKVLLIERGPCLSGWSSRVPLMSAAYDSNEASYLQWKSAPLSNVNNRELTMVGGKLLGGGSSINGLVYTRGAAAEYNRWSQSGRQGWSYKDVEPLFVKSEGFAGRPVPEYHGAEGIYFSFSSLTFASELTSNRPLEEPPT